MYYDATKKQKLTYVKNLIRHIITLVSPMTPYEDIQWIIPHSSRY